MTLPFLLQRLKKGQQTNITKNKRAKSIPLGEKQPVAISQNSLLQLHSP